MSRTGLALIVVALFAAGCTRHDRGADLDQLDAELAGNAAVDPAVASAIEDDIMVDPSLAGQADRRTLRNTPDPGRMPLPSAATLAAGDLAPRIGGLTHAPAPRDAPCRGEDCPRAGMTRGALAQSQAGRRQSGALPCDPALAYSFAWAAKLPAALPVYPKARVTEAAGSDAPGCLTRVVSFTTPAALSAVTDYYYTRATHAGFSADHRRSGDDRILQGARGTDVYFLILADRAGGGTTGDMIVATGR